MSRTSRCRRFAACSPATAAARTTLVEHGFRLPSALDNRPLQFDECEKRLKTALCHVGHARAVRTGTHRRRGRRAGHPARPASSIRSSTSSPARGQVPDLDRGDPQAGREERAHAGHDADQAPGRGSDATTSARPACAASGCTPSSTPSSASQILRELREGQFDVLVGVNLLARRSRPAGSVAGRHPRRRQGRLPAQRDSR